MSMLLADVGLDDWTEHPFVMRLKRYLTLGKADLASLHHLIECELTVEKRRDLVVDGYEYRKLCFVADGFGARYKLLRNGKRQILNVILPGDVIGLPGSFADRAHYSVIALTEMRIDVCPIDAYVQLCYRRPQFGLAYSRSALGPSFAAGTAAGKSSKQFLIAPASGKRGAPARPLRRRVLDLYSIV